MSFIPTIFGFSLSTLLLFELLFSILKSEMMIAMIKILDSILNVFTGAPATPATNIF